MISRPPAPDSLPTSAFQGETAEEPSPTRGVPGTAEPPSADWPYRDVDPRTGRLRPISAEEWRARMEILTRKLAEIDARDDTPDEADDEVMRNLEASRSLEGAARERDPRADQWWRHISAEEWQARHEEYKRRLAEIDAADDTPEEVYDQFMRNIDEERRRQGRPPAFEGYY